MLPDAPSTLINKKKIQSICFLPVLHQKKTLATKQSIREKNDKSNSKKEFFTLLVLGKHWPVQYRSFTNRYIQRSLGPGALLLALLTIP